MFQHRGTQVSIDGDAAARLLLNSNINATIVSTDKGALPTALGLVSAVALVKTLVSNRLEVAVEEQPWGQGTLTFEVDYFQEGAFFNGGTTTSVGGSAGYVGYAPELPAAFFEKLLITDASSGGCGRCECGV
jgi:hypothetical protein